MKGENSSINFLTLNGRVMVPLGLCSRRRIGACIDFCADNRESKDQN
jgi:hypothetical protein